MAHEPLLSGQVRKRSPAEVMEPMGSIGRSGTPTKKQSLMDASTFLLGVQSTRGTLYSLLKGKAHVENQKLLHGLGF